MRERSAIDRALDGAWWWAAATFALVRGCEVASGEAFPHPWGVALVASAAILGAARGLLGTPPGGAA